MEAAVGPAWRCFVLGKNEIDPELPSFLLPPTTVNGARLEDWLSDLKNEVTVETIFSRSTCLFLLGESKKRSRFVEGYRFLPCAFLQRTC